MNRTDLAAEFLKTWPELVEIGGPELVVDMIIEELSDAIARGERIEIRGFGTFSLHRHPPKIGHNPRNGKPIPLGERMMVHFKPGAILRARVNNLPS